MSKKLTVFLNGHKVPRQVHYSMTLQQLLANCKEAFGIENSVNCKLFDSGGYEISEDEEEFIQEEPIFLSKGEELNSTSLLIVYKKLQNLGHGGFGSVGLYQNRITKEKVAIKLIHMKRLGTPEDISRVYKEIQLLRSLKHPSIVELKKGFAVNDRLCFVMEYCRGGELKQLVAEQGKVSEGEVLKIANQLVDAIHFCHQSSIIHRDLKPENILFKDKARDTIKVVDFGIADMFTLGVEGQKSRAGTLLYVAPEILSGKTDRASPALDVWSLGCIFYYLLSGRRLFEGETRHAIALNILNFSYLPLPSISAHWHRLLTGMLAVDPRTRWSMLKVSKHVTKVIYKPHSFIGSFVEENESLVTNVVSKNTKNTKKRVVIRAPRCTLRDPQRLARLLQPLTKGPRQERASN